AAKALEFEKAALLRDEIQKLRDIIGNDANDIDDVNP
ncbi:MAG: UvrB/UvrC motif-containing protein, partial [Peptococcaceae bacterium]|nr:UvrB/UvrC motif-containing protein [Peptococcaceae bacterium]